MNGCFIFDVEPSGLELNESKTFNLRPVSEGEYTLTIWWQNIVGDIRLATTKFKIITNFHVQTCKHYKVKRFYPKATTGSVL